MDWDPEHRSANVNDPNANAEDGASAKPYEAAPQSPYEAPLQNPYGSGGTTPENPYEPAQNPYGAPPENPYAMPSYAYAPGYAAEPGYVPPEAHPLPLGEAIRNLPGQYWKVITTPGAMTFAGEMGKAAWNIVWVQLIGLAIIYTLLGLLGFAITSATTTT